MKTLFAKYNRERLPQFQIVTKIVELANGQKKSIKQALMPEAQTHIAEIYANYARLTAKYPHIKLVPPTLEDANTVTFPMADGISFESLLKQALDKQDESTFFALLDKFVAYVDSFATERQVKFVPCEKFKYIFGEWSLDEPQDLVKLANADMIFGNLFVADDGSITQIDYEWVFDFKIPKKYILWRAIFVLYWMNQKSHKDLLILNDLLSYVGVEFIDHEFYCAIDYSFQKFVHGVETKYFLNYRVKQPQIEPIDTRITKYPENSHMQLFYYQNDEINALDVRTQYFIDESQTKFSFDLAHLENLTHIRIDLTNFPVMANLEYVKVVVADGSEHVVQPCYSNANLIEGHSYTYLHNDPINVYYLTPLNLVHIVRVEIAVDLKPIKRSEVLELANQITAKQNEKIQQLDAHYQLQLTALQNQFDTMQGELNYVQNELTASNENLNNTQNELNHIQDELTASNENLNNTQNELNHIQDELTAVYQSQSWKITRPLRKFCKLFKG